MALSFISCRSLFPSLLEFPRTTTPEIIRKHYAQWTVQRQERISRLAQVMWADGFWSDSKKTLVSDESKMDNLVDGMGFEPTTPTLRTWCSPN